VPRARLLEKLQATLTCRLTLVSAPAGFGKSTVLTQWISEKKPDGGVAWLSLDEGDNDPVRFWDYFIAAVQTLQPGAGATASGMLHSRDSYATEAVLTALINDLAAAPEDWVITLDDYHLIKSDPVHVGLAFLLEHLPPRMHLIVATRADPALPLAHLRGRGEMLEIGEDDLRFTIEETAALFKRTQSIVLSTDDVSALNSKTEGWVVGLKMAGLSMRQNGDIAGFVKSFTGSQRYVMDYLVEEVLRGLAVDVRDFLLKTAVLEKLTAPLCDSLTGRADGQDMLLKLEQANMFLVPLDDSRQWHRYHHLFGELLRHQFTTVLAADEFAQLHKLASKWYEDNALPDDAIYHALAARDWKRTLKLAGGVVEERAKRGEMMTLLRWLRAVPDEALRTDIGLYRQYAHILVQTGQLDAADAALTYLESTVRDDTNLKGQVAADQADLAFRRQDMERSEALARLALSLLSAESIGRRASASYILGITLYMEGRFDEAWSAFTDGAELGRRAGDMVSTVDSLGYLGRVLWHRGKLHKMAEASRQAVQLAGRSPAAAITWQRLGQANYEWNNLEEAIRCQRISTDLGELRGFPENLVSFYSFLARSRAAMRDNEGVASALERANQVLEESPVRSGNRAGNIALQGLVAVMLDDHAAISRCMSHLLPLQDVLPFAYRHWAARLLLAVGERTAAMKQLEDCYSAYSRANAQGLMIEVQVYQALAAETPDEAVAFLSQALRMGEPEGYIRTFVDEGRLLEPVLRKALARVITPDYTRKLLDIIEAEERQRQVRNGAVPFSPTSQVLSERELEILKLLESGLSNRQIAQSLIISLGTAKTHVHNIFEKLDAKTRTQAVARARELKLL
jgi:LuxR family maltose regulon positive regulatory protein